MNMESVNFVNDLQKEFDEKVARSIKTSNMPDFYCSQMFDHDELGDDCSECEYEEEEPEQEQEQEPEEEEQHELPDDARSLKEFYLNIMKKVQTLKEFSADPERQIDEAPNEEEEPMFNSVVQTIERRRNDPTMRRQVDNILRMDQELSQNFTALKSEKRERIKVQEEMYENLREAKQRIELRYKSLADLLKNDSNAQQTRNDERSDAINESRNDEAPKAKPPKANNKFVKRNIERAKNSTSMSSCLTDEEKCKLDALLKDIDDMPVKGISNMNKEVRFSDEIVERKPFNIPNDDQLLLDDIDNKLQRLESGDDDAQLRCKLKKCLNEAKQTEIDGKYWRNEQRLKQIEDELRILRRGYSGEEAEKKDRVEVNMDLIKVFDDETLTYKEDGDEQADEEAATAVADHHQHGRLESWCDQPFDGKQV